MTQQLGAEAKLEVRAKTGKNRQRSKLLASLENTGACDLVNVTLQIKGLSIVEDHSGRRDEFEVLNTHAFASLRPGERKDINYWTESRQALVSAWFLVRQF